MKDLLRSWNLRRIPAATQGLDELNAGSHLQYAQIHVRLFVAEERGLRGDDVEVGVDAQFVAIRGDP